MERIDQTPEPKRIERDEASEYSLLPSGPEATYGANIEAMMTGKGDPDQFKALRSLYEVNGKTQFYDEQMRLARNTRDEEIKLKIYEGLTQRGRNFPQQLDPQDPETNEVVSGVLDQIPRAFTDAKLAKQQLLERVKNEKPINLNEMEIVNSRLETLEEDIKKQAWAHEEIATMLQENAESLGFTQTGMRVANALMNGELPVWADIDELFQVGGDAARWFVPFHDETVAAKLAVAMGVPEYSFAKGMVAAGETMQSIREYLTRIPAEDKVVAIRKGLSYMKENPQWFPEAIVWDLTMSYLTEDVVFKNNPEDFLDRLFRDIGSVGNYLWFGKVVSRTLNLGKNLMKSGAIRAQALASQKSAQRNLATLMTLTGESDKLKNWKVTQVDIGHSQLPRPAVGNPADLPDGVPEAAEHISNVRAGISEKIKDSRLNIFSPKEQIGAIEKQAEIVANTFGGKLRLGRSGIKVFDDGSGVRFENVVGSSDTAGFSSFADAQKMGEELGGEFRILKADGTGELRPVTEGTKGEFYVQHNQEYFFTPEDKMIFGESPIVGGSFLGRASNWLLTPSVILDKEVYSRGVRGFLNEQVISQRLDQLIAPFFKELSWKEQKTVEQIWNWSEDFAKRSGKGPSWTEIRDAFPDATDRHLTGLYRMRGYWDTVYWINNDRLYRDFSSRGFKTLYTPTTRYHGAPLEIDAARRRMSDGHITVLDPDKLEPITLNRAELKAHYEKGGSILETPIPISYGDQMRGTFVLVDQTRQGTKLDTLSKYPITYTQYYSTRFYKDNIFIRRVESGARINGQLTTHHTAVATARDRRSAQELADKLNAKRTDDTITYVVDEVDPRLADRDRVARDLEAMQLEGRIFFDERLKDPLASAHGGRAEVVDPLNAMRRVSRTLGRQVGLEDLVRNLKAQFKKNYGHLLQHDVEKATSEEISTALKGLVKSRIGPSTKEANAALQLWEYIRVMEGSLMGGGVETRRMAVRAAEFVQNTLFPKGSKVGALLVREAEKIAPVEWVKNLAFFYFMTTRPLRQLVLQGSQHIFLQALDPAYAVRWQRDSMLLMSGVHADNVRLAGMSKEHKFLRTRNAKMMGMSLKDYDTLVRRFNDSGLAQAVNMHTFASDVSKIPEHIPETTAGKVGQVTARTATVKPVRDALNKYGFQAGEGFNVAASYMMAVRRTMKEGKLKKISQLTEDDWMSVQARASNYALAMHRANASKYQYGFMSMPMQFLSFTHKVLLTFLQSDFALGRVTGLGNKAFTHMEANKIVLGQFLLFGGAGFGLKDEAEKFLVENGMDRYMDGAVVDMLAGGFLDILLDKSIQKALGDPELDFPFDEFLAPGANFVNVMKNAWEIGTEKPLLESMLGPGATAGSQIMQAYTLASTIFSAEDPEWSELEQYRMIMDAVLGGLAAGYNDYLTARLAWKTGILLSKQGIPHDYHATREEALAKGLFGLNPQGGKDLWELTKDGMDKKRSLDEIARSYFANINTLTLKFAQEGQYSQEYYLNSVRMHQALLSSLEPEERRYVMEQVRRMEKDKRPENDSIGDKIIGFINQGVPLPTDWLIYRLERSSAVSPEDKEALKRMLRDQEKALQGYSDNLDMTLEGEYDIIENTPAPANDELAPNTGRRTD